MEKPYSPQAIREIAPGLLYDTDPKHDGYLMYDITSILQELDLPATLRIGDEVVSLKNEFHISVLNASRLQTPGNDNREVVMEVLVPQLIEKTPLNFRGFTGKLFVCEKPPEIPEELPRRTIIAEAIVDGFYGDDGLRSKMRELVKHNYAPALLHVTLYTSENAPHGLSIDAKQDEQCLRECTQAYPELIKQLRELA